MGSLLLGRWTAQHRGHPVAIDIDLVAVYSVSEHVSLTAGLGYAAEVDTDSEKN